jgi:hypothetical protein
MHEISENTIMRRMTGGTKENFPELWRASYNEAHNMALAKYNVPVFTIYHPDVIIAYPGEFNSNYRNFWGLDK